MRLFIRDIVDWNSIKVMLISLNDEIRKDKELEYRRRRMERKDFQRKRYEVSCLYYPGLPKSQESSL